MGSSSKRATFEEKALQRQIMEMRRVDNVTNLLYLAREYLCLAVVISAAVVFAEYRQSWGLAWGWNVPVFFVAVVLVGALQHRLAGLGHESAHYSFMKNRFLNDLMPDLFCMFPLATTIHFYRLFHLGHHQFTNDPDRDPDLLNLGHGKRSGEFPMKRGRFIRVIYFCFLIAPARFLAYQWAYFKVNTLGKGRNVYVEGAPGHAAGPESLPRLGTVLGIIYVFGFFAFTRVLTALGYQYGLLPAGLAGIALAVLGCYTLPDSAIFQSPFRQAYPPRFGAAVRLSYYTLVWVVLALLRVKTAGHSAVYPALLWLLPLNTTFMFFMYLRDVYQHSNADAGRLTNSRVFFADPFTRWAVFVYGQDMHIPHHLFPAVPHYRLGRLHELLKRDHPLYRDEVVETHGTFRDALGRPTIIDEMVRPRPDLAVAATGSA
jgi:fatty acid desaturase